MSNPTLLVTRPRPDGEGFARLLKQRKIDSVLEPLLAVQTMPSSKLMLNTKLMEIPQAVVITSKHALALIDPQPILYHIPLYAPGEASAQAARKIGFRNVINSEGDAKTIVDLISSNCVKDKEIVYIRGVHVQVELAHLLKEMGYRLREIITYRAEPVKEMTHATVEAIRTGAVNGATLFSARSAQAYAKLCAHYQLADAARQMQLFAISEKVAEATGNLPWAAVHIAPKPNVSGMLESIDKCFATR